MAPDQTEEEAVPLHEAFSPASLRWLGLGALVCGGGLIAIAQTSGAPLETIGLLAMVIVAGGAAAFSASRGATRMAARTFAITFMVAAVVSMFIFGGVQTSSAVPLVAGVALSGVLLGRRGLLAAGLAGAVGAGVAAWATSSGWLVAALQPNTIVLAAGTVIGSIVMVCLVFLLGHWALDVTTARGVAARARLARSEDVDPVSSSLSMKALRRSIAGLLADPDERERAALLVVGLDPGSLIRLGFGPTTGDAVLRAVADRLRLVTRPQDRVGRSGDTDFTILAIGVGDISGAVALAGRIADQIDAPVLVGGQKLGLRMRIGVVAVSAEHDTADCVLRDGHAALAAAGNLKGANIGVFEAGLVRRAQRALELDEKLDRAIAAGELVAWYQPIVSMSDGRLAGFEALVRWETDQGVVSPGEFLPRAEATGVIVEIDRLVLRQACDQLAAWDRTHPDVEPWISVNLSAAQFETSDLVATVAATLDEAGIAPERLHLELTESALAVDVERTRRVLSELKELGVVLALDDFGTGWSSLSYIQSYPLDVVKIDQSFIRTIDEAGGQELAATIVFMANTLGLEVVAEGIETRTQYRVVRSLGVHDGQGYHFSRPLPSDRAAAYLRPGLPEEPSRAWDRASLKLVHDL